MGVRQPRVRERPSAKSCTDQPSQAGCTPGGPQWPSAPKPCCVNELGLPEQGSADWVGGLRDGIYWLKVWRLKSEIDALAGLVLSEAVREYLWHALPWLLGVCWQSLALLGWYKLIPVPAFVFTWHSPCVCVCLPISRTPVIVLGPTLLQNVPILTNYICSDSVSKSGHLLRSRRPGFQHRNFERTQSNPGQGNQLL